MFMVTTIQTISISVNLILAKRINMKLTMNNLMEVGHGECAFIMQGDWMKFHVTKD